MLNKIKNKVEKELSKYLGGLNKTYLLTNISPVLFQNIKEFALREGKRVRPTLFIIGYLGFSKKIASGLYTSALSLELLHDFMLVHDDIIDKSDLRRGKPSMHKMLDGYLKKYKNIKFNGQDLAIIIGDVMYALALHSFLAVKELSERKENAFKKLIEAAIYTGSGEFIELLYGAQDIQEITKHDIYKVYDLKTAYYTFSCPLSMGAILAGASQKESDLLFQYGAYLGRAFQIKDDTIGMFSQESKIGKSVLSDLQEAKKTILIWYAYRNSDTKNRSKIKMVLSRVKVKKTDLIMMREIITKSGALEDARKEVDSLIQKSRDILEVSKMKPEYKKSLDAYSKNLLSL